MYSAYIGNAMVSRAIYKKRDESEVPVRNDMHILSQ